MSNERKLLYVACTALALLALIGTWGHNVAYLPLGFAQANVRFWSDTLANPASRSITADLFAVLLPVFYWMFAEARRLSMRGIWLYILGSVLIAVSVALPVYLMHRAYAQTQQNEPAARVPLSRGDWTGMGILTAATLAYIVWSFSGTA